MMQHGAPVAQYWPGRGQTARSAKAWWWAGGRAGGYGAAPDLSRALARRLVWVHALAAATRILRRPPPAAPPRAGPVAEPWAPPLRRPPASPRHAAGTPSPRLARRFIPPPLGWRTAPPVGCRRPMPAEGACMPGSLHHRPWVSGADPDRYPVASGGVWRFGCLVAPCPLRRRCRRHRRRDGRNAAAAAQRGSGPA